MTQTSFDRPRTGSRGALAPLAATTAVIVLAIGSYLLHPRVGAESGVTRPPVVDHAAVLRLTVSDPISNGQWTSFLASLPDGVSPAAARRAGEAACLAYGGNADEQAVAFVVSAGVPKAHAQAVADAAHTHLCP